MRTFKQSNIETPNIRKLVKIRAYDYLEIGEHSNIDYFNVKKIVNNSKHSKMNVRCLMTSGRQSEQRTVQNSEQGVRSEHLLFLV